MGTLVYGEAGRFEIDDRTLAHIKIAITTKLRRQESFLLNWAIPPEQGSGRISIWMSPSVPLQFIFSAPKPPELSRQWLEALERSSHGIRGMVLLRENEVEDYLQAAGGPVAP
jgi:hypothetical protein